MYKVNVKTLRACKKYLLEYLFTLALSRADAKTVKEIDKLNRKIIRVDQAIRQLKNYNI